jgi:hypothetical protein
MKILLKQRLYHAIIIRPAHCISSFPNLTILLFIFYGRWIAAEWIACILWLFENILQKKLGPKLDGIPHLIGVNWAHHILHPFYIQAIFLIINGS